MAIPTWIQPSAESESSQIWILSSPVKFKFCHDKPYPGSSHDKSEFDPSMTSQIWNLSSPAKSKSCHDKPYPGSSHDKAEFDPSMTSQTWNLLSPAKSKSCHDKPYPGTSHDKSKFYSSMTSQTWILPSAESDLIHPWPAKMIQPWLSRLDPAITSQIWIQSIIESAMSC